MPDDQAAAVRRLIGPLLNLAIPDGVGTAGARAAASLALIVARDRIAELERWLRDNPPSEVSQWSLGG